MSPDLTGWHPRRTRGHRPRTTCEVTVARTGLLRPALARTLQFGESMFPMGGFAFSNGLESAIQNACGDGSRDTLLDFVRTATRPGGDWATASALIWAHRAAWTTTSTQLAAIDAASSRPQALERNARR